MLPNGKLVGGVRFDPVPYYYNQLKIGCHMAEAVFLAAAAGLPLPHGAPPEMYETTRGEFKVRLGATFGRIMELAGVKTGLQDAVLRAAISEN